MTPKRNNVDLKAGGAMMMLCIVWGLQQVAIKSIAIDISPILQISIRSGLAALLVWGMMLCKGESLRQSRPYLKAGCMVGVLFALEFLFVAEGLLFTSASHMAVFLYTAPAFAAIGLQVFHPEERLMRGQWAGICVAFTGIVVAFLFGSNRSSDAATTLIGDTMGILAGLSWGATTVLVRCTALNNAPATHTLFYQLSGACILLSIYAMLSGQYHFSLQISSTISMLFQIFVVGFASYLTWFNLMKSYLAAQLGVLSFMTPVFGVIAGVIFLGEEPRPVFIWGALLILIGIFMVSGWPWFVRKRYRENISHS